MGIRREGREVSRRPAGRRLPPQRQESQQAQTLRALRPASRIVSRTRGALPDRSCSGDPVYPTAPAEPTTRQTRRTRPGTTSALGREHKRFQIHEKKGREWPNINIEHILGHNRGIGKYEPATLLNIRGKRLAPNSDACQSRKRLLGSSGACLLSLRSRPLSLCL